MKKTKAVCYLCEEETFPRSILTEMEHLACDFWNENSEKLVRDKRGNTAISVLSFLAGYKAAKKMALQLESLGKGNDKFEIKRLLKYMGTQRELRIYK